MRNRSAPILGPRRGVRVCIAAAIVVLASAGGISLIEPAQADDYRDFASGSKEAHRLLSGVYSNLYGHDFVQVVSISSRLRDGQAITRRMQVVRQQEPAPGRALIRLLSPPDLRRTSILVVGQESRDDDVFLYLPAFGFIRRVSSSQRSDPFFGTDLSFEDLESKRIENYEVKLGPRDTWRSVPCTRVETRPRSGFESAYDLVELCLDDERPVILWAMFYRQGRLEKQLTVDPASVRQIGSAWVPHRASVRQPGRGSESVLEIESYSVCNDLPDQLFSTKNLELGDPEQDRREALSALSTRQRTAP